MGLLEFSLQSDIGYLGILLKAGSYPVGMEWGLPILLQEWHFEKQVLK